MKRSAGFPTRDIVTVVGALALLWSSPGSHAERAVPTTVHQATLISREPYRYPFEDRAAWLDFLRNAPGGESVAAGYARLFSADDFHSAAKGLTTTTSRIVYQSDGLRLRGILVEPRTPGRHPVVIFNHGGIGHWGRITLGDVLELDRLAARGYVVLASAFRGEGGSEGSADYGGGDADDALALIDVARSLPSADPTRVGMWGFSRGGLTTYAAVARSRRIAAAVILGGPTDLVHAERRAEFDRFVYPDAIPGYRRNPNGELTRRSPIKWPERLSPGTALLILHGGDDPRVAPADALTMAAALQRLRRSYRLKIYEGAGHDLLGDFADVRTEMDRWFDRYVRDGIAPPANGVTRLTDEETGS